MMHLANNMKVGGADTIVLEKCFNNAVGDADGLSQANHAGLHALLHSANIKVKVECSARAHETKGLCNIQSLNLSDYMELAKELEKQVATGRHITLDDDSNGSKKNVVDQNDDGNMLLEKVPNCATNKSGTWQIKNLSATQLQRGRCTLKKTVPSIHNSFRQTPKNEAKICDKRRCNACLAEITENIMKKKWRKCAAHNCGTWPIKNFSANQLKRKTTHFAMFVSQKLTSIMKEDKPALQRLYRESLQTQ